MSLDDTASSVLTDLRFETLSELFIRQNDFILLGISKDLPDEYWTLDNFLLALPDKWVLSFGTFSGSRLLGYSILSRKSQDRVHLHHFMVHPNFRALGLGSKMLSEIERRACAEGAEILSLKYRVGNEPLRRFYLKHGLSESGSEKDYRTMTKKLERPV